MTATVSSEPPNFVFPETPSPFLLVTDSTEQNEAFVLRGPLDVSFEDRPVPKITDPYSVLIRVDYTGICGSDVHYWCDGKLGPFVLESPMVLGHESAGTVIQVGAKVQLLKQGDRVAMEPGIPCRRCDRCKEGNYNICLEMAFAATPPYDGTLATYYVLPEDFCYKLPENVSLEEGSMLEPLSVAVHILRQSNIKHGDTVVVFGAGPIGLLCCAVARAYGARKIIAVDIQHQRLEFASEFAATATYKPSSGSPEENAQALKKEHNLGTGADVALDASGAEVSVQTAIHVLRHGVEAGKVDVKRLITSKVSFKEAESAFQAVKAGKEIKVLIAGPQYQILDRLDYLIQLVESNSSNSTGNRTRASPPETVLEQETSIASSYLGLGFQDQDISWDTEDTNAVREDLARANEAQLSSQARIGFCEDMLEWPIFHGRYSRTKIESLIFDPSLDWQRHEENATISEEPDDAARMDYQDPRSNLGAGRGVREEDVMQLVDSFLLNVHIKNPILDPAFLQRIAKSVAATGFGWEAQSCLVHVRLEPLLRHNGLRNTSGYSTAELYYTSSRKRMGLLTNTLLATECYFLAGVYEMYSLRPLQASISFNRACVAFQTFTHMKPKSYVAESQSAEARTSRLYWSCLKSEHEMSMEFRIPSSGVARMNYTSSFPPPPATTFTGDLFQHSGIAQPGSALHIQEPLYRGWYYYLADIAARRLLQRVTDSLYTENEIGLDFAPLPHLTQTAAEFERQLDQWYRTLPGVISFDVDVAAEDELAYHLQARAFEIKERIYRPFLFRIIHQPLEESERATLQSFVQTHALTCIKLIQQWDIRHRHHGTWIMARQSFASALLLLIAQKAGLLDSLRKECEQIVNLSISTLRYWEAEAPDLKASRQVLEDIIEQLYI
ncbi:hypothetical protein HG530_015772 [Fusarium avenaceum]|nr:hypothetical protein HG530_015772 [Fusarium avenaceum]